MREIITSRENAQVKLAAGLLARKKERDETGCFVAEGARLCLDAVRSGVVVRTLLLSESADQRYPALAELAEKAARTLFISDALAQKLSDAKTAQGVFAVCEKLDIRQCAVTIKKSGHYLLVDGVQDPGNLGTMLRTAGALGLDGAFLGEGCPDVYSPKVMRGAMGGVFRLPVSIGDTAQTLAKLCGCGVPVYAAALAANAVRAGSVDFAGGGAVLVGNEGAGLSDQLVNLCSGSVKIPMAPGVDSLNAAVAAGVLMWEMKRDSLAQ